MRAKRKQPGTQGALPALDVALLDALLARALRGEEAPWPEEWRGAEAEEEALRRIVFHGAEVLLIERAQLLKRWPEGLMRRLREQARALTMRELAHRQILQQLLARLAEEDIASLFMKGTAFAYALYPQPAARPRGDSDLLVREEDLDRARRALREAGATRPHDWADAAGSSQRQEDWHYPARGQRSHVIDLHWQVTNTPALAHVLPVDACFAHAEALPALGPYAQAMGGAERVIHAAINRSWHHQEGVFVMGAIVTSGDRLCWAYDLHLQAAKFEADDWTQLVEKAEAMEVAVPVCDALGLAVRALGTAVPEEVMARLAASKAPSRLLAYQVNASGLTRLWLDFQATKGFAAKLQLLLCRMFPSADIMRLYYPRQANWPLPLLYIRRLGAAPLRPLKRRAK